VQVVAGSGAVLDSIWRVMPTTSRSALATPTAARPRRAARAVGAVSAVVLSAGLLGGCSLWSPDVVLEPYAPADGLQAELGDVLARNIFVVSEGDGAPGVLGGALVSRADVPSNILVEVGGTSQVLEVAAGETVLLGGPEGEQVVIDSVEEPLGATTQVRLTGETSGAVTLAVPVLEPAGAYAELTPPADAGTGSTGEATGEATDEASLEPSAGPSLEPSAEPTAVATSDS
jgi:hypothetical protein